MGKKMENCISPHVAVTAAATCAPLCFKRRREIFKTTLEVIKLSIQLTTLMETFQEKGKIISSILLPISLPPPPVLRSDSSYSYVICIYYMVCEWKKGELKVASKRDEDEHHRELFLLVVWDKWKRWNESLHVETLKLSRAENSAAV